jgi:ribonuclease HII
MPQKLDKQKPKWLIGIDEVGRGPLAGPLTVVALAIPYAQYRRYCARFCPDIRDSKKLSPELRAEWNRRIRAEVKVGNLVFATVSISAATIDKQGMGTVARSAVARALKKLLCKLTAHPEHCDVRLDGALYAPDSYPRRQTIIKGDELEPAISLASIVAKVHRDRYMTRMALQFPQYRFELHKGYGTKQHRQTLKNAGISILHRKSFLTRII